MTQEEEINEIFEWMELQSARYVIAKRIYKAESQLKEAVSVIDELILLIDDKDYEIDSFTTQPAINFLHNIKNQIDHE